MPKPRKRVRVKAPLYDKSGERVAIDPPQLVYAEVKARALKDGRVRITITGKRLVALLQLVPNLRQDVLDLLGGP